jgi:hypothetical protein
MISEITSIHLFIIFICVIVFIPNLHIILLLLIDEIAEFLK